MPLPRTLSVVLALLVASGMFVLLMADRAPGYVLMQLTRLTVLAGRVETAFGTDLIPSDLPLSFDQAAHLGLWSFAGLVAALLFGGSVRHRHILAAVISVSVVSELAQSMFTSLRSAEWSDLAANLIGAGLGVGAIAVGRRALAWRRRLAVEA